MYLFCNVLAPPSIRPLPGWLLAPLLVGSALALGGGYWDDAWHTDRGRDSFLIAPHIAIYSGVALAGGALAAWVALAARAHGAAPALRHRPLALALVGVAVTLASGPLDNAWHVAFGRDAVIWSPPHTLGIVGTAALAAAVLIEVGRSPRPWANPLRPVVEAFVLAALLFLVVEYETDVPQFDAVWYLPMLAATSALALALVRLATPQRFAATATAAVHLAFIAAVSLFLLAAGFDTPKLPLLVVPALVLDLWARTAPVPVLAAAYVTALYAAYVPTLTWLGAGVQLDAADVVLGLPLAYGAVSVVLAAVFLRPSVPAAATARVSVGALAVGLVVASAAPAVAHDPGQGDDAGSLRLIAHAQGRDISLEAAAPAGACRRLGTGQIVARRAGETLRAPLARSGCRYSGKLAVSERGRWFVYAELRHGERTVESWLPVKADGRRRYADERRYAYFADRQNSGAIKAIAGGAMYLVVLGVLAAMVALTRAAAAARTGTWS